MNQATQPDNPSAGSQPLLQICLLGRFQVTAGGQLVADRQWRLRKSRNLVKLLALAPQHRLHREQLLDALWPELLAADAAHNLHQVLNIARRALDPAGGAAPFLQLQDDVLSLAPESALWIDAEAFETAAGHARQTRDVTAYRAALDRYAGELLPDDRYEDWVSARRESLHRTYLDLLSALAQLYEHDLDYLSAIETAERILASEPAQEEAHRALMRLYARSGRRPQALRQYQLLTESLRREVETEPDAESERLYQQILAGQFAPQTVEHTPTLEPGATMSQPAHRLLPSTRPLQTIPPEPELLHTNLPLTLDSFVGRESAMADIQRLLGSGRLVTLTGSGGCGKTRLAIRVASELVAIYPDGVWLVEFAALSDPTLVAQEVAGALDVREQPGQSLVNTLIDSLRNKEMLLLFDNCEHLIAACAQLAESLLRACTRLHILATSREALHVAGETNYRVPSLSVPAVSNQPSASFDKLRLPVSAQQGIEYEAVRLFVDRAEAANRSFHLTDSNASAVAQICAQLDGMPLAIELAAARVTSLSAEQIAGRLEDRFRLLTGGSRTALPRQQTLQAAIDWSYDLLTEPERVLLRRLSVFAGGWTLEAAEVVCSDDGGGATEDGGRQTMVRHDDVLDILTWLVDKSLVTVGEEAGEIRYGMLETVRQFAQVRLNATVETNSIRTKHLDHYLALLEELVLKPNVPMNRDVLRTVDVELQNLLLAHGWCDHAEAGPEKGLCLLSSVGNYWHTRGLHDLGLRLHTEALLRRGSESPSLPRTRVLFTAGMLAYFMGRNIEATEYLNESLSDARAISNKRREAMALSWLGAVAVAQGNMETAREHSGDALVLAREIGDKRRIADALNHLGELYRAEENLNAAASSYEEGLALSRELADTTSIAIFLINLAKVLITKGSLHQSRLMLVESIGLSAEVESIKLAQALLEVSAGLAAASGEWARAARSYGASEAYTERVGIQREVVDERFLTPLILRTKVKLGEAIEAKAYAAGRMLSYDDALAESRA